MRIFVNDVYHLMKQASFSYVTMAGHSTAAGTGETPFLTICYTQIDFCNHSKIFNDSGVRTTP